MANGIDDMCACINKAMRHNRNSRNASAVRPSLGNENETKRNETKRNERKRKRTLPIAGNFQRPSSSTPPPPPLHPFCKMIRNVPFRDRWLICGSNNRMVCRTGRKRHPHETSNKDRLGWTK
ncbi:hypothetical protein FS842_002463 [Serendipita sp. 407]|nr:hypothetical protein FS842_002463 [Serendipita sp. 407]